MCETGRNADCKPTCSSRPPALTWRTVPLTTSPTERRSPAPRICGRAAQIQRSSLASCSTTWTSIVSPTSGAAANWARGTTPCWRRPNSRKTSSPLTPATTAWALAPSRTSCVGGSGARSSASAASAPLARPASCATLWPPSASSISRASASSSGPSSSALEGRSSSLGVSMRADYRGARPRAPSCAHTPLRGSVSKDPAARRPMPTRAPMGARIWPAGVVCPR